VRTLGLFNRIPDTALASYLSGLVIGHEILGALARMPRVDRVTLIGAPALCRRYAAALERHGIDGRMPEGDAAARGIHRIAMAAQGTGTER
jgi:2-dehydro-3-deoxygalactonokinase